MTDENNTAMQRSNTGGINWRAPVSNTATLIRIVGSQAKRIEKIAQNSIDVERMSMLAMLAAQKNPEILACTGQTIFMSLLDAAKADLDVDGVEGALVPFFNKKAGEKQCQFMPMYQGLVARALADGVVSTIFAEVVHENDEFDCWNDEHGQHFKHRRTHKEPGPVTWVYAVATYPDGTRKIEMMTEAEIEKVRASSKTGKFGPWVDWWEEMAKKTVIKRLLKTAGRKTGRLRAALEMDNRFESQERRLRDVNMDYVRATLAESQAPKLTAGDQPDPPEGYDDDIEDEDMHEMAKRHAREAAEAAERAFGKQPPLAPDMIDDDPSLGDR